MKSFDPHSATEAEALAEAERVNDRRPYLQWYVAAELAEHRAHFMKKPIEGIEICVQAKILAPDWLADEFTKRCRAAFEKPVRSWDEVFDPPVPKGRHLNKFHEVEIDRAAVLDAVASIVWGTPPPPLGKQPPIDVVFWEQVKDLSGVGEKRAEALYREAVKAGSKSIDQLRSEWNAAWKSKGPT